MFFLLSAYLLSTLLFRERAETGTADLGKFFVRRALRIWPLFYVYVGACVLYYVAVNGSAPAVVIGRTVGHLFFLDNFFTAFTGDYNPLTFTEHLWTIAFEEQVYLVMPLLVAALVALRSHAALFMVVAAAVLVSQPLLRAAVTTFDDGDRIVWVVPFLHFDAMAAGLLLGAGAGSGLRARVPGDVLVVAGVLVLAAASMVLPGSAFLPDRRVYLFTVLALAFFLVVLGCLDPRSWTARLLAAQPFVFLGRISYGLYVWHLAGLHFGPDVFRLRTIDSGNEVVRWISVVAPALALTIAVSAASYFLLERPFLRIKRRFTVVPNRED